MYKIFEELLKEKGVSAYRVAQETGVSTATLTSWKKGVYTPKPEKLQKIADYFGVQLEYLINGRKEEKNYRESEVEEVNGMQIFKNPEFGKIRTVTIGEQPWFVGKDVAEALGYGRGNNKSKALTNAINDHVNDDDKQFMPYEMLKGCQNGDLKNISHYGAIIINESGLYALIFGSKLPNAKKFKHWVTGEVLPAIHKTGHYEAPNYAPKATSIGEVVNLIKIAKETMRDQGATSTEIAETVKSICDQFGVNLPRCFVKPKETTMKDVDEVIDFIYSFPKNNRKNLTYEDFVIYKSSMKQIGCDDDGR